MTATVFLSVQVNFLQASLLSEIEFAILFVFCSVHDTVGQKVLLNQFQINARFAQHILCRQKYLLISFLHPLMFFTAKANLNV